MHTLNASHKMRIYQMMKATPRTRYFHLHSVLRAKRGNEHGIMLKTRCLHLFRRPSTCSRINYYWNRSARVSHKTVQWARRLGRWLGSLDGILVLMVLASKLTMKNDGNRAKWYPWQTTCKTLALPIRTGLTEISCSTNYRKKSCQRLKIYYNVKLGILVKFSLIKSNFSRIFHLIFHQ